MKKDELQDELHPSELPGIRDINTDEMTERELSEITTLDTLPTLDAREEEEGEAAVSPRSERLTQREIDDIHCMIAAGSRPKIIQETFNISRKTYYKVRDRVSKHYLPSNYGYKRIRKVKKQSQLVVAEATKSLFDGRAEKLNDMLMKILSSEAFLSQMLTEGKTGDVIKLYDTVTKHALKREEIILKSEANKIEKAGNTGKVDAIKSLIDKIGGQK